MAWAWWFVLASFLRPLVEIVIVAVGEWWFFTRFREDRSKFNQYVIQITTVGTEQDRVNEIISEIRSYPMSMPYEIWVVNEPERGDRYPAADRVITVPSYFETVARCKARALEYSRGVRIALGYDGADTKITFLDDDTSPTWEYLETAFAADYDISQGITAPRINYGDRPWEHFLLSHIDDLRYHNCLTYCSTFQGVFGKPLFVHGEGLTITGHCESVVTWRYPVFASEDLTFGCNAAAKGMRWGFFHEYIQLTSPWTFKAYFKQRRRWMWGNLHAIMNREVLPLGAAVRIATRYLLSLFTFLASGVGMIGLLTGQVQLPPPVYALFWCSFVIWLGNFALSGWVNSAPVRTPERGRWSTLPGRLAQTLVATVLGPATAAWAILALLTTLYMGNPRTFEVIAKTHESSGRKPKDALRELEEVR